MSTRARVFRVLGVLVLLLVAAAAYTAWSAWKVAGDLRTAESSVRAIQRSIDTGDDASRDQAVSDLQDSATAAQDRTSGWWWALLSHVPAVGDDVQGVRALTGALDVVATDGLDPVLPVVDDVDKVVGDGRIDLEVVRSLQKPLDQAQAAFTRAETMTSEVDSSGFVGLLRVRYDLLSDDLADVAGGLRAASEAVQVLPSMAGGDGPRDYFLIFQNNAEIRATGGLPGSWALLHAEDGRLSLDRQGSATDFPRAETPVLPLTPTEQGIYGDVLGTYFQDPGFTPDFPRAAALFDQHWQRKFPQTPIDGVIALDPVALSYLVGGTGPVTVDGRTLTASNLVPTLLNQTYIDLDPAAQDAFFQDAAAEVFDASTSRLRSPLAFVEGLRRSATEGRFLVAPFDQQDATMLEGAAVLGALSTTDGHVPHVDVGINDNTASKMSYYLRYDTEVQSVSCQGGRQDLAGSMTLRQSISPAQAAALPDSVTGANPTAPERGAQQVAVQVYGPAGGQMTDFRIDGKAVGANLPLYTDDSGRQVVSLNVVPSSRSNVRITWSMTTGEGQDADGVVGVTPSVVAGDQSSTFTSACGR